MLAKQKILNKLFPRAYIAESTMHYQKPKNNYFLIWIIIGLMALIICMFSFFQTDLIKDAAKLSEVIR